MFKKAALSANLPGNSTVAQVEAIMRMLAAGYKTATAIQQAAETAVANGKLPPEVSEAEKATLVAAISSLRDNAAKSREIGERLERECPKLKERIAAQKQQIQNDFTAFSAQLETDKRTEFENILNEDKATEQAQKTLEQEFRKKKAELKQKRKTLVETKKTKEKTFAEKKKIAESALQKALIEADTNPPDFDKSAITAAGEEATALQTQLNRTKGILQSVYASPAYATVLQGILEGNK